MKGFFLMLLFAGTTCFSANAQQKIEQGKMNYFVNPKPNTIIYHDTIFTGKKQFEHLFYRTQNSELIRLLEKHQSNKVAGQILGIVGSVATILGIKKLTSGDADKGSGWVLLGGGFATTLTGGYLTFMGQKNLLMVVTLFNQQNNRAALGIGIADNRAGLVYKF